MLRLIALVLKERDSSKKISKKMGCSELAAGGAHLSGLDFKHCLGIKALMFQELLLNLLVCQWLVIAVFKLLALPTLCQERA